MKVILSLLCIFLLACSAKQNEPRILQQQEMAKVLWDVMLAEEYFNTSMIMDSTRNKQEDRLKLYLKVFQLHNISREDFNASLKYYTSKPDILKIIYDSLGVKAERERRLQLQPAPTLKLDRKN